MIGLQLGKKEGNQKFKPDDTSVISQLEAIRNESNDIVDHPSAVAHDDEDFSSLLSLPMPFSVALLSPDIVAPHFSQVQLVKSVLEAKGYTDHALHYAQFFVDFLSTAEKMNSFIQQSSREALIENLSLHEMVRSHFGALSSKPNEIFEQNALSNSIARSFLQELFNSPAALDALYQDNLFRLNRQLEIECKKSLVVRQLQAQLDALYQTHNIEVSNNFSILEKCHDPRLSEFPEMEEIRARFESEQDAILARLNPGPRCMIFLPCEVEYTNGDKKLITLVSLSGTAQGIEHSPFTALQLFLKGFCARTHVSLPGQSNITFEYVEHASERYDWLLHEANRAIYPLEVKNNLPKDPSKECAEKKIFSELVKHLLAYSRNKINNIRVLGETNIALPRHKDWAFEQAQVPKNEVLYAVPDKDRLGAELSNMENEYYLRAQHELNTLISSGHASSSVEDATEELFRLLEEVLHFKESKSSNLKTLGKKIELASTQCLSFLKSFPENALLASIQDFLKRFQHKKYVHNARQYWKLKDAYDGASSKSLEVGFTVSSNNPSSVSQSSSTGLSYYPITYLPACTDCQKQKMPFLSTLLHASGLELPDHDTRAMARFITDLFVDLNVQGSQPSGSQSHDEDSSHEFDFPIFSSSNSHSSSSSSSSPSSSSSSSSHSSSSQEGYITPPSSPRKHYLPAHEYSTRRALKLSPPCCQMGEKPAQGRLLPKALFSTP